MKKALAEYEEVRKYIASYNPKPTPVLKPEPIVEFIAAKPKGIKVESAEITKLEKGYFFVTVIHNGQRYEIRKRFKSTTKAQE